MQTLSKYVKSSIVVMILACSGICFAEPAPVYDADSMPQFDSMGDDQEMAQNEQEDNFAPLAQASPQPMPQTVPSSVPTSSRQNERVASSQNMARYYQPMSYEQRIRRMEQQINNMQNTDMTARIESLQDQMQGLRGQIEQLTHQLQQVQQQRAIVQPVAAAKPAPAAAPKTPAATPKVAAVKPEEAPKVTAQPNVAEEQQIYQTAYNLIKSKKYNEAIAVLQNMLQKYPSGQFASNAHYWLGELYGLLGKNDQALAEFNTVVKNYPESPRVSDAQLKVGLIFAAQFKWADAKSALKRVINHYPGTTSSRLASEQLKQIKQAGH